VATKRKVSNPLALAVMALLYERPMHPYEMVTLMRERGKHESVRLRYSSLYSVVSALEREGLIEPKETVREGRRPERTVYEITSEGSEEFLAWLRELLREPVKEYTQFAAGLSFLPGLLPEEAIALLKERVRLLEQETGEMRSRLDDAIERFKLPRLFLVESEHELMLREAELEWVRTLVEEIESGALGSLSEWRSLHAERSEVSAAGDGEEKGV
jgi:DNA-binding PadR family transcriptional regulator